MNEHMKECKMNEGMKQLSSEVTNKSLIERQDPNEFLVGVLTKNNFDFLR